ncbi:MAG: sensor histidine kinase [Lachnospiraceae bacterium]|nr:sensor histidine kinase [Lachnospiraceae bacterium]
MKKKLPKTFSARMILCNMLIIFCIAAFISIYNYRSYRNDVIQNETVNSEKRLESLSARLTVACDEMINIVQNCSDRQTLFLFTSYKDYLPVSKEQSAIYAANVLKDFCAISGYSQYLYKITIYNQDNPLIQSGTSSGNRDDVKCLTQAPWFSELLHREANWFQLSLVDNPFPLGSTTEPKLLPLLRPLNYYSSRNPEDAWVFLAISPSLFQDSLSVIPSSSHLAIMTAESDIIAGQNLKDYDVQTIYHRIQQSCPDTAVYESGNFRTQLSGKDSVLTWRQLPVCNLMIYEVLPVADMPLDHHMVQHTIGLIFCFCIGIGLLLSLLFSRYLTLPIERLSRHLDTVADGNFAPNPEIESDDEIGWIGKRINRMSRHIQELMENRILAEKEKKDLEIKMLQAQINPHFLYNTLDSIKWIAKMQHNNGIVQVVTALSSLLKNMAKGFNEKVTLKQELDFLNDYVIIEKIRYIELFDLEVEMEDPKLSQAHIVKLTLQPIVENAIFSGIEPSGNPGLIKIRIFTEDQTLFITITDNGIGIDEETIQKLLTDTARVSKSYMSGIGLPNVDRRLKLVYGEPYGLSITSEIGSGTTVSISLPLEY